MNELKFKCPHCNQSLEVPQEMLGTVINCPACKGQIQLPKPAESTSSVPPKSPIQANINETSSDDGRTQWYYNLKGKRIGPANEDTLKQLIADGTLNNETLVWEKNFDNWIPVGQTALRQVVTTPPPLSGSAVNNGLVWTVAFIPIIGTILEYVIAGVTKTNADNLWFITLFLNIAFCVVDDRVLKNAGYDTKKFGGWVWLVPVYLYKRAKTLNQSLAYFITWMACFVVAFFISLMVRILVTIFQ